MQRHQISRLGGLARAARLPAARRSEIARMGWLAMVARRFGGDEEAAKAWFVARGLAAQDSCIGLAGGRLAVRLALDPGPMPAARN